MDLDLSTWDTAEWTIKTTTGCESVFGSDEVVNHASALVGHLAYLCGGFGNEILNGFYSLDITTWHWKRIPGNRHFRINGPRMVLVDDKFYIFGGTVIEGEGSHRMWIYDTLTDVVDGWSCKGQEFAPQEDCAAEYIEPLQIIVAYGGSSDSNSDSLVAYRLETSVWETLWIKGAVPPPRHSHFSCVYRKTHIFFAGGSSGDLSGPCEDVFHLDCTNEQFVWSEITWTPAPLARAASTMCCVGSRIYIFGGYFSASEDRVEHLYVYDLLEQCGTGFGMHPALDSGNLDVHLSGPRQRRSDHAAVFTKNSIFVIGGVTSKAKEILVLSLVS